MEEFAWLYNNIVIILSMKVKSSIYYKESLPLACKACISSQLYIYVLDGEINKRATKDCFFLAKKLE